MTTLAALANVKVTVPAGYRLFISPGSECEVIRRPMDPRYFGAAGGTFGPFNVATDLSISSIRGVVNYFFQKEGGNMMISTTTPIDNDGMPDGTLVVVTA